MPNNEYIDKVAACNEIKRFTGYLDDDMIYRLQIALNRIPAADVEPVRHGRWKEYQTMVGYYLECSYCGAKFNMDRMLYVYRYCPYCGAKKEMDEV